MSRPLWDELKAADFSPARVTSLSAALATEQDADVVMFLYRNENPDDPNEHGYADVLVQKHRSGPTGAVKLLFIGQFTQFQNVAK